MNHTVRRFLIDLAHQRPEKTIGYQQLADTCDLGLDMSLPHHRQEIGVVLGDISAYEHAHGRPLLSAIVVFKETLDQGDGFYRIAETLGLGSFRRLKADLFGMQQLRASFDFWQDAGNYAAFRDG